MVNASIKLPTGDTVTTIPITFEGDAQVPDRMKGKLTVSLGFFSVTMETVHVGDTTYSTNLETGEWEVSASLASAIPSPVELLEVALPALRDAALIGEETLEGTALYRLRGSPPPPPADVLAAAEGTAVADFLISLDDFLILQIQAEGEVALDDAGDQLAGFGMSGTAAIEMTMTFSAFGEPVVIEPPQVP